MIRRVRTINGIKDPYTQRILGNLLGLDPWRVYTRTPGQLMRLAKGLTSKHLQTRPGPKRWSIAELLVHFRDAELAMAFRIRKAIAESGSRLPAYDQNRWASRLHYRATDPFDALALFVMLRKSHISLVRRLTSRELARWGMHPERGKETVERMIHMLAGHDINHLRQVKDIRRKLLIGGGRERKPG